MEHDLSHTSPIVLVIDDVDSTRAVLCDMLKELGFPISVEARNGREALSKLRETPVQLILCDQIMDEMPGVEFLRTLRQDSNLAHIPVIFVSAVGAVSTVEEAINLGAADYIVKPVSFRKLRRKIEQLLKGESAKEPKVWEISL